MAGRTILAAAFVLATLTGYSCQDGDWWEHMQLYQIYPRSFKDSDGDGIGDIKGVIANLDHLVKIGANATWLSPIFPSPMLDFGYDISDYYNIAEEYGTIQDLKDLIVEAKKKNIRILLDFVPNHSSDKCDWFIKSANRTPGYENYYVWHDGRNGGKDPPSNWISVFRGSAWTYHEGRKQWYLHQFLPQQPDLNYREPLLVEEMKRVLSYWLDMGIAGFRVDAIPHLVEVDVDESGNYPDEPVSGNTEDKDDYNYLNHIHTRERDETYDIVYQWRATLDNVTNSTSSETRILLMEAMSEVDLVMRYYGNATHEGAHFPFNFNLAFLNKNADAVVLFNEISNWFEALPEGRVTNWVIGNHDQPRVASRFGPERSDGITMLAMLLPGVAVTYNGEEIAMLNYYLTWEETQDPQACNSGIDLFNSTSRDPERTPFQWDNSTNAGFSTGKTTWLPVADNYVELNLQKQTEEEKSAYKFYLALSELRQNPVVKGGDLKIKAIDSETLAFTRDLKGEERVIVVVNTGEKRQPAVNLQPLFSNLTDNLTVLVSSVKSSRNPGDTLLSRSFVLEPFEALALSKGASVFISQFLIFIVGILSFVINLH